MNPPLKIRFRHSGRHFVRFVRRLLFTRWVRGFK